MFLALITINTTLVRMLKKVLSNFYLRNIIVLVVLILLQYGLDITNATKNISNKELYINAISVTLSFFYILIHNVILYERFLIKKKYVHYIIGVILILLFDKYLTRKIIFIINNEEIDYDFLFGRIIFIYLGFSIYIANKYFNSIRKLAELKSLQKEIELSQLKSQLNPHFLYNSLNNIYSYLLTDDFQNGKELILKLSEMMRHLTERTDQKYISLDESIEFMENYISFEKERLGNRVTILTEINIPENNLVLAPLIFFPLIENAFKHGTNSISSKKIKIKIEVEENILSLMIQNEIINPEGVKSTNKGIQNVSKRLEILYPGKHIFNINKNDSLFIVHLEIDLS